MKKTIDGVVDNVASWDPTAIGVGTLALGLVGTTVGVASFVNHSNEYNKRVDARIPVVYDSLLTDAGKTHEQKLRDIELEFGVTFHDSKIAKSVENHVEGSKPAKLTQARQIAGQKYGTVDKVGVSTIFAIGGITLSTLVAAGTSNVAGQVVDAALVASYKRSREEEEQGLNL